MPDFVLLEEDNIADFDGVIPAELVTKEGRFTIGAGDEEGNAVGAVSCVLTDFEYEIDWLYVDETERRRGIGRALLDRVVQIIRDSGEICPVSCYFEYDEKKPDLYHFFRKLEDFDLDYSHKRYRISQSELNNSPILKALDGTAGSADFFFDWSESRQLSILDFLSEECGYEVPDYDAWKETCIPELCRCIRDDRGLRDLIFVREAGDDTLCLSYLYGKSTQGLMDLIKITADEAKRLFPNAEITFDTVNAAAERMAKRLFAKAEAVDIYEASLWQFYS